LLVLLPKLLFILKLVNQRSDVRQNLDFELVAMFQVLFGTLAHSYSSRGTRNDYGTGWKRGALRQKTDKLGDTKDEITGKR
jgi:hypothetical protein